MLISVIIPAFNVATCIGRAIDSVLNQSLQEFELIIIDDGSTDATVDYIQHRAAHDHRIRVLQNPVNAGPAIARNRGLAAAQGEWIAVVDADDACDAKRLETLHAIAESTNADLIADNLQLYDAVAQTVTDIAITDLKPDQVVTIDVRTFLENCITARSKFDFGQLKAMMRRQFLLGHQLRYPEELRHGEDFIMYASILLAGGRFVLAGSPYYIFTERVGRASSRPSGLSRTRINFEAMRNYTLRLLSHPAVQGNAEFEAPLRRRATAIRWHQQRIAVEDLAKRRNIAGLSLTCLRDWRAVMILLRKLLSRISIARTGN